MGPGQLGPGQMAPGQMGPGQMEVESVNGVLEQIGTWGK